MSDFQRQYALWDEFLAKCPRTRLATMTLDEYTQAGSKDSFTYWIESHPDEMGSIWGGSAFKFGVFSRGNTDDKKSDTKLSYSEAHGWYSSLGATAEEAFQKVRGYVVQVPMEAVFEAYVAKHLARQLVHPLTLRTQAGSFSLVRHLEQDWFRLKPDLLVREAGKNQLVLDTKWKLLDDRKATGADKYGLDQGDFYQLHAYGQSYLDGHGDVVLIYPRTDAFDQPLPVFDFPESKGLRLWVLPFCLRERVLVLPTCGSLDVWHDMSPYRLGRPQFMSADTMADGDELSALRAENSRLIALLESHGIEWRVRQQPSPPPVESSRLSTGE